MEWVQPGAAIGSLEALSTPTGYDSGQWQNRSGYNKNNSGKIHKLMHQNLPNQPATSSKLQNTQDEKVNNVEGVYASEQGEDDLEYGDNDDGYKQKNITNGTVGTNRQASVLV